MTFRKSVAAGYRKSARRLADRAIRLALVGNVIEAEKDWLEAKDSAAKAASVQAYENGYLAGKKAKREGSR